MSTDPHPPKLETFFVKGSLLGLIARRHPYDFVETYVTLRKVYGYQAHYVNLGLWADGEATTEPGRRLAFRIADALDLQPAGRLIDAGSGLGQAAVDLCARHDLAAVHGVNPNPRQVAFANALAASQGLGERVRHIEGDACASLGALDAKAWDGVLAVECVGHFANPDAFLADAARALRPGGRIAFCLNVAKRPLTWTERAAMNLAYGFVPESVEAWLARLAAAGFQRATHEDLTDLVLTPMTALCLSRLDGPREALGLPRATLHTTRAFLLGTQRAVARGRLGYALVAAQR